ncbi:MULTISPECIES: rubredoxin-like domain-containing protein [unclassified Veillonella]|uniref:rubredoxin-like domain-containing protein n=1 Tax=unclassified Veillonella TaxID=2630086 RepID=UPI001389806B|nr:MULTISPECIES: hypothetical protein [unclassified Veillonella]KAF1682878.1 hypothetical protein VER_04175 [Veillonella sp. R32]
METKKQEEKKIQYIICRVCGYIETADKADQPCPACGFPKTVWAEYTPRKLNPTRKRLLDLHLHPIAVHFPIAGSALTVGLPILGLLVPYTLSYRLFDFAMMVCLVMPLLVLIGGISGYIGGKLRYKTTTAPVLKFKIYLSVVYFILTVIQAYVAYAYTVHAGNALIIAVLGVLASVSAAILGKKGSHLFAGLFGPYVQG